MKEIKLKSSNLVIQKYLEDPMLIRGRKFDLRVFALLTPTHDVHVFETCYVRLSSEQMKLTTKQDLCNKYMHLTNNAIQELSKNYGVHEKGNIISVPEWEGIVRQDSGQLDFKADILPQIEECVKVSMLSCAELMNPNQRWHCFEVYGYDFMIDRKGKVWMIEINSNPSFTESNDTVKTIIERMLDDAFKLTLDKVFSPKRLNPLTKGLQTTKTGSNPSRPQNGTLPDPPGPRKPILGKPIGQGTLHNSEYFEPNTNGKLQAKQQLASQTSVEGDSLQFHKLRQSGSLPDTGLSLSASEHQSPQLGACLTERDTSKPLEPNSMSSESLFPLPEMPNNRILW